MRETAAACMDQHLGLVPLRHAASTQELGHEPHPMRTQGFASSAPRGLPTSYHVLKPLLEARHPPRVSEEESLLRIGVLQCRQAVVQLPSVSPLSCAEVLRRVVLHQRAPCPPLPLPPSELPGLT